MLRFCTHVWLCCPSAAVAGRHQLPCTKALVCGAHLRTCLCAASMIGGASTPECIYAVHLQVRPNGQEWQGPSVELLFQAFRKTKGTAGPDSWCSRELRHLPPGAIAVAHQLFNRWWTSETLPQQMLQSRQVSLPKARKLLNTLLTLRIRGRLM